jgi:hypothetical protein
VGKDGRLYAQFTLDFCDHEKIVPLSDAAFRCLVEATIWSRKRMTDGWLASRFAVAKWGLEVLNELSTNDTDKPSLEAREEGWQIRDFAEHQDTKEEIEARRERNKLNGQKGCLAKGKRVGKRPASKSASQPLAETETETHNSTTANAVVERPRKRASRLPEGWYPPKDVITQMEAECPTVDFRVEHRKFIDYWMAKSGKDATKNDWNATWRNWIRRASEHHARAPADASNVSAFQRKKATNAAVFDLLADDRPPELMA